MTKLPETKWTPLYLLNPNRRWWQFWKPRLVPDYEAMRRMLLDTNELLEEMKWTDYANPR